MKVLIIGAGNGGLSFGVKLLEKGIEVNLYDKLTSVIKPIIENNSEITLHEGEKRVIKKFGVITNDLKEGMNGVDFIFVVTPAFAHSMVMDKISEHITNNQVIVLHPGRTGGALEAQNVLKRNGKKDIVVAEAETLLFACRKKDDLNIEIYGTKNSVGVSTIPFNKVDDVVNSLNEMLPYFDSRDTVWETSLNNIGSIFHPIPFIFNLNKIENNNPFKFYLEGITPKISKIMEQVDNERIQVGKRFTNNIQTTVEWLNQKYSMSEKKLYDAIQKNKSYYNIYTPMEVNSRYVFEDIPTGLVPISQLGKLVNVSTPTIDSILIIANLLYNHDFISNGRNLKAMGLDRECIGSYREYISKVIE